MLTKLNTYLFLLFGLLISSIAPPLFATPIAEVKVDKKIISPDEVPQATATKNDKTTISTSEQSLFTKLANLKNMHAQFSQTLTNPQQKFKQQSKGEFWVSKPSFFKWQVQDPQKQLLLSNGQKLWNYDEELEQVTISEVPKKISQAPYLLLLTGDSKVLSQLFNIKELSANNYRLTPKVEDQSLIKYIDMQFINNLPTSMLIQTEIGQSTHLEFHDISTQPIPANTYQFTPPEGVDVLG